MDINYISEFVVLAEIGNFLAASEELYISQSSLSKHIKHLESELGVVLFNRTTRKISLTDAGEIFLQYAREIRKQQNGYTNALAKLASRNQDSISIGVLPTMAQYDITNIIFTFQRSYPEAKLSITMGDAYDLAAKLLEETLDFAFLREREFGKEGEFERIFLCRDRLVAVVPKRNPLAEKPCIEISDLKDEELCVLATNTLLYDLCDELCRQSGFEMKIFYQGHHLTNIADFVTKGQAIGLLMEGQTRFFKNPWISIIPIEPSVCTDISLCRKKGKKNDSIGNKFVEIVNGFLSEISEKSKIPENKMEGEEVFAAMGEDARPLLKERDNFREGATPEFKTDK